MPYTVVLDAFQVISAVTPVGPGVYEDSSADIAYVGGWTTYASTKDSGGSYANSYSASATATLTFTGNDIQWIGR